MVHVYVHLSNVWGDTDDSLGWRHEFWEATKKAMLIGDIGVVVDASSEHVARAREVWRDSPHVSVSSLEAMDWRETRFSEVVVDCSGTSPRALLDLDHLLLQSGFRRAGRAWGEAGKTRRYVRPRDISTSVKATLAEWIVQVGAAVVHMRDDWLSGRRFAVGHRKLALRFSRSLTVKDVLDDDFDNLWSSKPYLNIREFLPDGFGIERPSWGVNIEAEQSPADVAMRCYAQHGVWPISFSYPSELLKIEPNPALLFSRVIPGFPYSFQDQQNYLASYHEAYLGLTHRKAGWDCFRHVEILAAGAIPFMPDIAGAPEFSMIHYPKAAMEKVVAKVKLEGGPPNATTRRAFRRYFEEHLTSRAMAAYALGVSGLQDAEKILFVDAALGKTADYQSVLTLIGLKQLRGSNCELLYPVDYVYGDTEKDVHSLYGRGFGYTRVLDGSLRSGRELGAATPDVGDFDVVVVGSITRNTQAANALLHVFPAERTIWIHGEDTPPNFEDARELRTSGTHVFVRAIHTRGR